MCVYALYVSVCDCCVFSEAELQNQQRVVIVDKESMRLADDFSWLGMNDLSFPFV